MVVLYGHTSWRCWHTDKATWLQKWQSIAGLAVDGLQLASCRVGLEKQLKGSHHLILLLNFDTGSLFLQSLMEPRYEKQTRKDIPCAHAQVHPHPWSEPPWPVHLSSERCIVTRRISGRSTMSIYFQEFTMTRLQLGCCSLLEAARRLFGTEYAPHSVLVLAC